MLFSLEILLAGAVKGLMKKKILMAGKKPIMLTSHRLGLLDNE